MAMSAASMAARIETAMEGVTPEQLVGAGSISGYRNSLIVAMCQGIIAEIQDNAVVTTNDAQGGVNTGTVA